MSRNRSRKDRKALTVWIYRETYASLCELAGEFDLGYAIDRLVKAATSSQHKLELPPISLQSNHKQ